jgi:hypothetical protein
MSTLSPFFPGLRVRARRATDDGTGRWIAVGTPGVMRGLDRANRPQIEFDGHAGRIVSCEERDLEPIRL